MENIRNIIFDLGGVLYNINYQASLDAFKNLGMANFDQFFTQATQNRLFDRFDRGEISPAEFRKELQRLSGLQISDKQIDDAWNAMLLDFPEHRIELLEGLKGNYRIFLLSNTNAINYPHYQRYMQRTFGFAGLDHLFEKTYLSYKMGVRKPEREAYELILRENELQARQTLFIDDTRQHVFGARQAGLHSIWLDLKTITVTDLFNWHYQLRQEVAGLL
jgi:glucose-1-phosphatase